MKFYKLKELVLYMILISEFLRGRVLKIIDEVVKKKKNFFVIKNNKF